MANTEFNNGDLLTMSYYDCGFRSIGARVVDVGEERMIVKTIFLGRAPEQYTMRLRGDEWRGMGVSYKVRPANEKECATISRWEGANSELPLVNFDADTVISSDGEVTVVDKPKQKRERAPRPTSTGNNTCLCGCGTATASRFAPGHDAKVKGLLKKVERGVEPATVIPAAVIEARAEIGFVINNPVWKSLLDGLAVGQSAAA